MNHKIYSPPIVLVLISLISLGCWYHHWLSQAYSSSLDASLIPLASGAFCRTVSWIIFLLSRPQRLMPSSKRPCSTRDSNPRLHWSRSWTRETRASSDGSPSTSCTTSSHQGPLLLVWLHWTLGAALLRSPSCLRPSLCLVWKDARISCMRYTLVGSS